MKVYQKLIIVCISGATVWGLSYLSSLNPAAAMLISSVNATITMACAYFTGFPAPKET